MLFPDLPLANAVIHALGWTLIHFLWQGMVLAGAFWGIWVLARPGRANLRYWSGLVCMLAALVIPFITFLIYFDRGTAPAVVAGPPVAHVAVGGVPSLWMGIASSLESTLPYVVGLWALGVALLSMRTAIGWLGTRRLVRIGAKPASEAWCAKTAELARHLGVRCGVRVLESTRVAVPTVIGWLKPAILIPVSVMAQLPREQIEMVIAHELGHIRRNDYLFNFLQLVVETLLFYHPAVRWMSQRIREDRELCCDDLVVSRCGKPVTYARALAALEEVRSDIPIGAVAATGGDLFLRVRRIVEADLHRNGTALLQVALVLLLAAMTTAGAHPTRDQIPSLNESRLAWVQITPHIVPGEPAPIAQGALAYSAVKLARLNAVTVEPPASAPQPEPKVVMVEVKAEAEVERTVTPSKLAVEATPAQIVAAIDEQPQFLVTLVSGEPLLDGQSLLPPANTPVEFETDDEQLASADAVASASIRPVYVEPPKYPFRARAKEIEGTVRVTFSVNRYGRVRDARVVDSFPEGTFDSAALHAIKRWRFESLEDRDESQRLAQEFDFNLRDAPPLRFSSSTCGRTGSRTCNSFNHNMHVLRLRPRTMPTLDD